MSQSVRPRRVVQAGSSHRELLWQPVMSSSCRFHHRAECQPGGVAPTLEGHKEIAVSQIPRHRISDREQPTSLVAITRSRPDRRSRLERVCQSAHWLGPEFAMVHRVLRRCLAVLLEDDCVAEAHLARRFLLVRARRVLRCSQRDRSLPIPRSRASGLVVGRKRVTDRYGAMSPVPVAGQPAKLEPPPGHCGQPVGNGRR